MTLKLNITPKSFTAFQTGCIATLLLLNTITYFIHHSTGSTLLGYLQLFDVGEEQSIPTYFSVINLLLTSILAFMVYAVQKSVNANGYKYWAWMSLAFLYLSVDEGAGLHELLWNVQKRLISMGTLPAFLDTYRWIPLALVFVLLASLVFIPFLKILPKRLIYRFFIAGTIFLTGAVGFEYIGILMIKTGISADRTDLLYQLRRIFEEGFEMFGIALFNITLFKEIVAANPSFALGTPHEPTPSDFN